MKCAVEFCGTDHPTRWLCDPHIQGWFASPEYVRCLYWWKRHENAKSCAARADWVRRISAEHRNGGLGAPLSDERTMGGGSGGSDRESLTSGQPGALVGDGGGR